MCRTERPTHPNWAGAGGRCRTCGAAAGEPWLKIVSMQEPTQFSPLLDDRVAVVTGAGGGIGAATARLFAQHGAHVIVADIDAQRGDDCAAQITASGGSALAVVTDVRESDQVSELTRAVLDRHGRVDVLVNNVGHWVRHPG